MSQSIPPVLEVRNSPRHELAIDILRSFGKLRFAATGWSMLPTLWPGETLVVERVGGDEVRLGDVVLVNREGRFCAHRVIGSTGNREDRQWITRGDALPAADRCVDGEELLGRVSYVIREGRLVAVPKKLGTIHNLLARIARRSMPAARAFVYLNQLRHNY